MKLLIRKNQKGFAMMETVVFMSAFLIIAAYCIDLFTVIHTGIVNNIGARTYLFETLEHRSNIDLLRQSNEELQGDRWKDNTVNFQPLHYRFHTVSDEEQSGTDQVGSKAVGRTISSAEQGRQMSPNSTNNNNKTNTVYIKSGYGICLDSQCI